MPPRLPLFPIAALKRRTDHFAPSSTDSYRLLNRTADGFPNLTLDKFNDVLIANLYSTGKHSERSAERFSPPQSKSPLDLLSEIQTHLRARSVYLKHRPIHASRLSVAERAALAPTQPLLGDTIKETSATENGTRYLIRPTDGLSVGLFLDMREQRAWVKNNSAGKTVLNCFAYTCAFGLVAQQGGASRAINVDVSKPYLDWGKRNAELNGLPVDSRDYIFGDVFDWLNRFGRAKQKFDLVILDPPSFSTTKQSRFSVEQNYPELIALAAAVTTPGGHVLASANTADLPLKTFKAKLQTGLADHSAQIISIAHEPEIDFPVAADTNPYLKICLVKIG